MDEMTVRRVVFLVYYFPPMNSSGARRIEAMSKYFSRDGINVTVITPRKKGPALTETMPEGVDVIEIDWLGQKRSSDFASRDSVPLKPTTPSSQRAFKNFVAGLFGQLPDPRLPFAMAFLSPLLAREVRQAVASADVIVGSTPPWPTILAAALAGARFRKPIVFDYRDHFSECHEWPGSPPAKWCERQIDRALASKATGLVTISEPMKEYYSRFNPSTIVILNGYDHEAIDRAKSGRPWRPPQVGNPILMRYLGTMKPGRVPRNLLGAMKHIVETGVFDPKTLRLECYGDCAILERVLTEEYAILREMVTFNEAVPYDESLALIVSADYLLFSETSETGTLSAQGILTTKIFEYIASGRPIIADISPTTLAGRTILSYGTNHRVASDPTTFEVFLLSEGFAQPAATTSDPRVKVLSRAFQAQEYLSALNRFIALAQGDVDPDWVRPRMISETTDVPESAGGD
jgi:glycosyltransferase involved in cell wall biosynthesis